MDTTLIFGNNIRSTTAIFIYKEKSTNLQKCTLLSQYNQRISTLLYGLCLNVYSATGQYNFALQKTKSNSAANILLRTLTSLTNC